MAEDTYYLTTSDDPQGRGILAIITLGSPQMGDEEIIVCDVNIVNTLDEAKKWFEEQMISQPWTRDGAKPH